MAYSDMSVWEHLEAAFGGCKHYVEIQVAGRAEPFRAKSLCVFEDDGFVEVRLDGNMGVAIRADQIVTIMAV